MKLFISWSGSASQQIAQELHRWLPLILPAVKPFITTDDISKGARWQGEIAGELESSNFGIVCVTAENLQSQWLAFEAGALSKHLSGKVATVLFGVRHADVHAPLGMFQGTLFNEADFLKLLRDINNSVDIEHQRPAANLDQLYSVLWGSLAEPIELIMNNAAQQRPAQPEPQPNPGDLASEILALLRQQNSILSSPEKFLSPVLSILHPATPAVRKGVAMGSFRRHTIPAHIVPAVRQAPDDEVQVSTEEEPPAT